MPVAASLAVGTGTAPAALALALTLTRSAPAALAVTGAVAAPVPLGLDGGRGRRGVSGSRGAERREQRRVGRLGPAVMGLAGSGVADRGRHEAQPGGERADARAPAQPSAACGTLRHWPPERVEACAGERSSPPA
jgi:hypothetical protein